MTVTVRILKNAYGGDGLGRLGDGRVVFVPGAWTGESVLAEIVEEKRHFVRSRLVEVLEASADRRPGDAFAAVPGCPYATLSPDGERRAKEAQLVEFLERARIGFEPSQLVKSERLREESVAGYRNKAVYHFARQRGAWALGYRTEPSHEIVDLPSDPTVVREINAALPDVRRHVLQLLTTGASAVRRDVERQGNVTVRWSARTGVKWWIGEAPKDLVIKEDTAGRTFEVPGGGFYQVNPAVADRLVRAVTAEYARSLETAANVLDLYCGVGVFGLALLDEARRQGVTARLTGIESGREAIDFARRNAAAFGTQARFFAEQVGRNLRRLKIGPRTCVVIDPPRGGLEPGVADFLARSPAPRIFAVSCDPATLARDLKPLSRSYAIESVRWFDMFPRTARFETFVTLRRRSAGL